MTTPTTVRMMFYGSLRPKCYNFKRCNLTESMVVADNVVIKGYTMIPTNNGYPIAIQAKGAQCVFTIVDVPSDIAERISMMEKNAGYKCVNYKHSKYGECQVWVYPTLSNWYDHPNAIRK